MTVFSWNVNGLRAILNRGDLQNFIKLYNPDILGLQEIKIQESQLAELKLAELFPDYEMFWSFAKRKGYAGTAIWTKKSLAAKEIILQKTDLSDKYGDACSEGRLTAVKIGEILVVNMYAPNGKEDLSRIPLRVKWDAYINSSLKNQPHALLMGDFNVANEPIDVAKPETKKGAHGFTIEERQDFKNYLAAGFRDIWREENPDKIQYTWWSFRVRERGLNGWRIDYALAKNLTAKNAEIYEQVRGSDHCPISVEVKL
ncbi:MAG: exodeoxyribonuclease III [Candidatus Nomurabacteria bacterium]|jgi:exodeoxyribonuclease-3|nr:exodeoxyribonuclease III [Candidatus Nomurabacteria bacterium]